MTTAQRIEKAALGLKITERAHVAVRLLESLDDLSETEIQGLWAAEAERRRAAYKRGETKAKPAAVVFAKIRRELAR